MNMDNLSILFISFHDLVSPTHGSARLVLSSAGAMALRGHHVKYIRITQESPKEFYQVKVTNSKKEGLIEAIDLFGGQISGSGWFKYMKLRNKIINILREKPDIIICESRPLFLLCSELSRRLKVPWVIRVDRMRSYCAIDIFRHTRKLRELFMAPPAIAYYALTAKYADLAISVAKWLEKELKRLLVNNIVTIEPTHLTLSEPSSSNFFEGSYVDEIEEPYVIATVAPTKNAIMLLKALALRTPDITYIITRKRPRYVVEKWPKNIKWIGIVKDYERRKLYERALCVLIYRSWMTGICISSIEALSYGKACIANSPSVKGLSQEVRGIIINDNILKWPEIIQLLKSDDSLRKRLEIEARGFFEAHLSPKVHAIKMEKALANVIKNNVSADCVSSTNTFSRLNQFQ